MSRFTVTRSRKADRCATASTELAARPRQKHAASLASAHSAQKCPLDWRTLWKLSRREVSQATIGRSFLRTLVTP